MGKAEITKIAAELARGDYLSKLWTEAEKSRHVDTHRLQNLLDELHDVMKVKAIAITRLLTAPPAPAVPEEMTGGIAMSKYKVKKSNYVQWVKGWNACRAERLNHVGETNKKAYAKCECSSIDYCENCLRGMLAQPVSIGYKLPEGGNGHDTRR